MWEALLCNFPGILVYLLVKLALLPTLPWQYPEGTTAWEGVTDPSNIISGLTLIQMNSDVTHLEPVNVLETEF